MDFEKEAEHMSVKLNLTELERAERVSAVLEIKNLIGRRQFYQAYGLVDEEFDTLWTKKSPAVYTQNDICIQGVENIRKAFLKKQARVGEAHNEMRTLTTPLVYLATDARTAQGFWYSLGHLQEAGKPGEWVDGRICADFILEDGVWKIWHLLSGCDLTLEAGTKRTDKYSEPHMVCDSELTMADVEKVWKVKVGNFFDPSYNFAAWPELPKPYRIWEEMVKNVPDCV